MSTRHHVSTLGLALLTPLDQREGEYGKREVHVAVYVDGRQVDCGGPWYFFGIYMAGVRPGRYWFANCSDCGEPGCAQIWWPAIVEHKGGMVHWRIPTQPSTRGVATIPRRVRFEREQYRAECTRFLDAILKCQQLGQPGTVQTFDDGEPFDIASFTRAVTRVARIRGVSKQQLRYSRTRWMRDAEDGGYR